MMALKFQPIEKKVKLIEKNINISIPAQNCQM